MRRFLIAIILSCLLVGFVVKRDRGEVSACGSKFIWSNTGEAFVPDFATIQ